MQKRVSERLGSGSIGWSRPDAIAIAHLVRELRALLTIQAP